MAVSAHRLSNFQQRIHRLKRSIPTFLACTPTRYRIQTHIHTEKIIVKNNYQGDARGSSGLWEGWEEANVFILWEEESSVVIWANIRITKRRWIWLSGKRNSQVPCWWCRILDEKVKFPEQMEEGGVIKSYLHMMDSWRDIWKSKLVIRTDELFVLFCILKVDWKTRFITSSPDTNLAWLQLTFCLKLFSINDCLDKKLEATLLPLKTLVCFGMIATLTSVYVFIITVFFFLLLLHLFWFTNKFSPW